jgi:hypothetical protein
MAGLPHQQYPPRVAVVSPRQPVGLRDGVQRVVRQEVFRVSVVVSGAGGGQSVKYFYARVENSANLVYSCAKVAKFSNFPQGLRSLVTHQPFESDFR